MNAAVTQLTPLQDSLIKAVEATPMLALRFQTLRCVTNNASGRRGAMSFVFSGDDTHQKAQVAVKFLDPEYLGKKISKRALELFEREAEILKTLEGKERCLQLVCGHDDFSWPAGKNADGSDIVLNTGFFAVEWLDHEVDDYFLNQDTHDAGDKLRIFRDILLASEAIHRHLVCHRDLKIDNIRIRQGKDKKTVVIIDFGLAIKTDSKSALPFYPNPMGASAFSPPEAFAGFEGERDLAFHSDSYALGCLLFHLFNKTDIRYARDLHTPFITIRGVIASQLLSLPGRQQREAMWALKMREFKGQIDAPKIDWDGHSVPQSAKEMIGRAYKALIRFDYRHRETDLSVVRDMIDSAIKAYAHEGKRKAVEKRKKAQRDARIQSAKNKEERLKTYLERSNAPDPKKLGGQESA